MITYYVLTENHRRTADSRNEPHADEPPTLLMLDETSMGLAPLMVEKIFDTIRNISAQGVSIMLVEQNARLTLEVAQRCYVLESRILR